MGDWFDEGGSSAGAVDVPALLDSAGGAAIGDLVATGALVSLGLTRDGGALGITVTVDGRWRREYFRDADGLQLWMAEALPAVRKATEATSASAAPRSRPRRSRSL